VELTLGPLRAPPVERLAVEVVERKGRGHPDTICDGLAEQLSRSLGRWYLERFGGILHHNVDKILLRGGASQPAFGGGSVLAPIDVYLAGRATRACEGVDVPIEDLAVEGSRAWLRQQLHALDPERHVRIHCLVRGGSASLVDLFTRQEGGAPLANDTSIGVGYAPLSQLERAVLAVESRLTAPDHTAARPEVGEDVKVMGIRRGERLRLTVACPLVDRHVASLDHYRDKKEYVMQVAADAARGAADREVGVQVNTADDLASGRIYLTVTGTSAEAGDDGQAGRGNRVNGLITPYRPVSLEAAAGKNPVTHVGKLYQVAAQRIAEALVRDLDGVAAAECYLVSQIGRAVDDPQIADVKLDTPGASPADYHDAVEAVVRRELGALRGLWREAILGELRVF
jgi:S-adenosylmethionine synthetase